MKTFTWEISKLRGSIKNSNADGVGLGNGDGKGIEELLPVKKRKP